MPTRHIRFNVLIDTCMVFLDIPTCGLSCYIHCRPWFPQISTRSLIGNGGGGIEKPSHGQWIYFPIQCFKIVQQVLQLLRELPTELQMQAMDVLHASKKSACIRKQFQRRQSWNRIDMEQDRHGTGSTWNRIDMEQDRGTAASELCTRCIETILKTLSEGTFQVKSSR